VRQAMLHNAILPTLLKLALPTMSVLIAQTAVNVAETYYVGLLGTDALAGVALVFPVFMLMMTMAGGGLGSGVSSAMARAVGAGNLHDADAIVLHAIILAALIEACSQRERSGAVWHYTACSAARLAHTKPRWNTPTISSSDQFRFGSSIRLPRRSGGPAMSEFLQP
jgi:MatE